MTSNKEWSVVALSFLLQVFLVWPVLTPDLKDIGSYDETSYIVRGRTLGADNLPTLDQYPLTVFLFKLISLPLDNWDFWFVYSCAIGRFFLLILLWISFYTLAKRFSEPSSPLIAIGFLLLSPAAISLTRNAAHALFTVMATFALREIILFHRERKLPNLRMASVFVSLAALSRMGDGTFLFGSLIALSILLGTSARRVKATLAAATIPFVVIIGGYMLTYYALMDKSPLAGSDYFYQAFEMGHGLAYADQFPGLDIYTEGEVESSRIFGTPEENHYSVITAIQRNPTAYMKRIPRLAKAAVWTAIGAYGGPLSLWFFLLALQGCIELISKKQFMLLCILIFWLSYLVIYILLVFQSNHFLMPFPIVFCLSSIGLTSFVSLSSKQRRIWSAILLGLVALALARNGSLRYEVLLFLIGLWIVWTALSQFGNPEVVIPSALVFLLSMMLLLRWDGVPSHKLRRLGTAPEEQAMLFLKRNFAEGTAIGAYEPREVYAAKLTKVPLANKRSELQSKEDLQRWIQANNLEGIYVEGSFRRNESAVWALIETQIGKSMDVVFTAGDPEIQILRIH
jgi:hypothetical protein